jgi:hypothetical protein
VSWVFLFTHKGLEKRGAASPALSPKRGGKYIAPIAPKMVLIDCNIWVPTADTYEIKKIDSVFFLEE